MRKPSWEQCATSVEELLLGVLASLFSLLGRLLGSTCQRLLGGALRLAQAAQWALGFFVPGSFQLAHTVANRVRLLLEHSAALGIEGGQESLQRRLSGLPPPVAACLEAALADLPSEAPDIQLAHLKLTGHVRFTPPGAGSASAGTEGWNRFHADAYLCPGSASAGGGSGSGSSGGPGYVLSATVQLGPLSWVRGFVSFLQGSGSSQWKLCSPFRARDLGMAGVGLLGSSPLAAFLAEAPCCPTALLPSSSLQWRALGGSTAEATVRGGGEAATAVYHFDRGSRIVQASIFGGGGASASHLAGAGATHRGAGRLAATGRGAGRSSSAAGPGPKALVIFYRQHQQRCGMQVPTELEACWGSGERQRSFLHCDLAQMSAWRSLEMLPGGHAHIA
ncbi:hypothetical protein ABPG77_003892 [Micractinium sp. CCAP 211/92]